jgi:hypothetical protein
MRGKVVGPTIKAVARILPSDEEALVEKTFESNLSLMMRIGRFISNLGGGHGERVYLEIVPVEEEK